MAVRAFNGTSDDLICSAGAVQTMTYGTFAYIVKQTANSGATLEQCVFAGLTSGNALRFVVGTTAQTSGSSTIQQVIFNGTDYDQSNGVASTLNQWLLVVGRKASGSSAVRWSIYNYNTSTWTHGNSGDTTIANWTSVGSGGKISFYDGDQYPHIRVAARAAWVNNVKWATNSTGDGQIEAAGLEDSAANWLAQSPDLMHLFNQASTATAVEDLVGTSDQTSISGTTVVNGDDPPGFDFSLGGGVTGTAAASLGSLAGSSSGTPTVLGTSAATLGALSGASTGLVTVPGNAAGNLSGLSGTASGLRTVLGTSVAALGALTASGAGGSEGNVSGVATSVLGALNGTASGSRKTFGTAQMDLGSLLATAESEGVTGMDPKSVRTEIATRLRTIPGLRVSSWDTPTLSPPHAVIFPQDITFDLTYQRGLDEIGILVLLSVGKTSDRSAHDRLDEFAAGSGVSSVKEVLEAGTYESFEIVTVESVEFGTAVTAGTEYLAAKFLLSVRGPGA